MTKKEAVDKINNWRKEAKGKKGADIGSGKPTSLYDYALGHGSQSRSADRGGKRRVRGTGTGVGERSVSGHGKGRIRGEGAGAKSKGETHVSSQRRKEGFKGHAKRK